MVTTNILQRTFRIRHGDDEGTCFTIDIQGRQYLVTAYHVVENIKQQDVVRIFHNNTWKNLGVEVAWMPSSGKEDIAILSPEMQLSPTHPLDPSVGGLAVSQDVYFCGYPYGLKTDLPCDMNRGFPLPLVKKGIVSGLDLENRMIFIDGINNPGFSGGPVVFHPSPNSTDLKVAGVISGYRVDYDPVFFNGKDVGLRHGYNTGLVIAYDLKNGIEYIACNPSGAITGQT